MEKSFVIMISGANRGIGLAIAKNLYHEKIYCLSLGVRNTANIDLSKAILADPQILLNHYDAKDPKTITTWIDHTIAKFGKIDAIINCAGIYDRCGIENFND